MPAMTSSYTRSGIANSDTIHQLVCLASDVRASLLYAKEESDLLWKHLRTQQQRIDQLEAWQEECGKNVEDAAERGEAP